MQLKSLAQCIAGSVAGIDEVGRGALAGPVVAAACILPILHAIEGITDSKKLTEDEREIIYEKLIAHPEVEWSIGIIEADVIDQVNILQATFLAMQQAVSSLKKKPDHLFVDGNQLPSFPIPATAIIDGDFLSPPISAASIIAKVSRDRLMRKIHHIWPVYKFADNKGYGTKAHIEALAQFGPCPIHRKTFDPLRSKLHVFKLL